MGLLNKKASGTQWFIMALDLFWDIVKPMEYTKVRRCCSPTLHHITLHYRHFKRHVHLKWPVMHQQLHVMRNTAHQSSTQASNTASQVRPKRKISCAAAQIAATQIAATLTISFPRWRHMSLTSYWGQQRISHTQDIPRTTSKSYPGQHLVNLLINNWQMR